MTKPLINAAGIVCFNKHMQVLSVYSLKRSSWGFPFGKADPNEDLLDCAIRETFEETGLLLSKKYIPKQPIHIYKEELEDKIVMNYSFVYIEKVNFQILERETNEGPVAWLNQNVIYDIRHCDYPDFNFQSVTKALKVIEVINK